MKTLHDYISKLLESQPKENSMKKLKKFAQVDLEGNDGLYETTVDRWSRNAKHQIAKSELLNAGDEIKFDVGETVLYENREVTVKIPLGPKGKTGVMINGQLKLVSQSKLSKLEENVMGGMQSITPINRIMQLAGLSSTTLMEPVNEEVLNEADASDMMTQLVTAAMNLPQYKGNAEAARLYVIGSILSAIYQDITTNKFQTVAAQGKMQELNAIGPMGADLIKTSQTMTQGQ